MNMFTVYVDDSGNNDYARIIVAAYCIATVKKWKGFEREWNAIGEEAGFKHFHMTEFAACKQGAWCRDCKKGDTDASDHPWREWSSTKRERVLKELAQTVNKFADHGVGIAFTKQDYKDIVLSSELKDIAPAVIGQRCFTFAVQTCGGELAQWRAATKLIKPLKFVFDLTQDVGQRDEIASVFFNAANSGPPPEVPGMERSFAPTGVSYESRKVTIPLLSADMLAWVAAKIRVRQVFGTSLGQEATIVGHLFIDGKKLGIGSVNQEQLRRWAERELAYRAKAAGGSKLN